MNPSSAEPASRTTMVLATLVVVALTALLAYLSTWRELPGYETETDFVGGMVAEAARLAAGEPLRSEFHPPGFPVALVAAHTLVGEWFAAGKALAVVAAGVSLLLTFWIFRGLAGPWAAWGALGGLVCSATFLKFSIQATSDAYFLGLLTVSGLAVLFAAERRSLPLWFVAGFLVGLGLMTRTNGLTQFLLLTAPLFTPGSAGYRVKAIATAAAGVLAVVGAFFVFAALTDSNLFPKGTYHNLAMTYFSQEKVSWEGVMEARSRFTSLKDVLLYDPLTIVKTYASSLFLLLTSKAVLLSGPLLALLFLPGLVFLVGDRLRGLLLLFLLATAAQILLVNFKAFEPRYFLFLAPWLGASAGYLAWRFWQADWHRLVRGAAVGLVLACFALSAALALADTGRFARASNPELSDAFGPVRQIISAGDVVVSRKPHLSFLTGATYVWLPTIATDNELREALSAASARSEGRVFLFYGQIERRFRPELESILTDQRRPEWLAEAASGVANEDRWALYEYQPMPASGADHEQGQEAGLQGGA